jgi:hypothetical protein
VSEWLPISELKLGDMGRVIEVSHDGSIISGEVELIKGMREKEFLPFDKVRVKDEITLSVGPFYFGADSRARFRRRE